MAYGDRQYYRPTGFSGFKFFPPGIKWLLIINAAVFLITMIGENIVIDGVLLSNLITAYFGLIPFHGYITSFYPWQLITYQFIHGGFMHIFFNMFLLWMFGMEIENIMGTTKFLIFYLLSGIGGGLLQLIVGASVPTIGASGSVFGVMVAFAMMFPDRPIYIYFLLPVKAKYLIIFMILLEFLSVGNADLIAHVVHVGGAITGFLFVILDKKYMFNFSQISDWFTRPKIYKPKTPKFGKSSRGFGSSNKDVEDADFYEINSRKPKQKIDQAEIDRILDKISQSGYQNLTEEEKRILFEASKHE